MVLANRAKHIDFNFENNVGELSKAIEMDRRVSFKYFRIFAFNEKRYNKYTTNTSPWLTLYHDDNYYLVAYDKKRLNYYRIDRISDIKILDELRQGEEEFEKLKKELPFRTQSTFNLFGGEKRTVTLGCRDYNFNIIADKFGNDLIPQFDKSHNYCTVNVSVVAQESFFAWIFGTGNKVFIVGPEDVRKEMRDMIDKARFHYRHIRR